MSCPRNTRYIAGGRLAAFQGLTLAHGGPVDSLLLRPGSAHAILIAETIRQCVKFVVILKALHYVRPYGREPDENLRDGRSHPNRTTSDFLTLGFGLGIRKADKFYGLQMASIKTIRRNPSQKAPKIRKGTPAYAKTTRLGSGFYPMANLLSLAVGSALCPNLCGPRARPKNKTQTVPAQENSAGFSGH